LARGVGAHVFTEGGVLSDTGGSFAITNGDVTFRNGDLALPDSAIRTATYSPM